MTQEDYNYIFEYLFNQYRETKGIHRINLTPILEEMGGSQQLLKQLETEGIIQKLQKTIKGSTALFTIKGIKIANPNYFEEWRDKAIYNLMHENENKCDLLDAFGLAPDDVRLAEDIAECMMREGFIEINNRKRILYLTQKGREYYGNNKGVFIP